MRFKSVGFLALVAIVAVFSTRVARAQSNAPAERFVANAINISEVGAPGATQLDLVVTRWSSEAERERFVSMALENKPAQLLELLQKMPKVGYLRTPQSLAYDLHFAMQTPDEEGGRRVILATDRPIGFWEAVNRPRTINYPFTVIEMRLNKAGEGEGKVSIATRITGNKRTKTLELENWASQPVMLKDVRAERR